MNESDNGQEPPQTHRRPRGVVRQECYKTTRRWVDFKGPSIIKFVINGEEGIRLSDALEGNWAGFQGRDDGSLFEDDRGQIILRLQVRSGQRPSSVLLSNIST